jgi:hypothetical protein
MMVSEVPQIDLSSLSRQQLQHLLETSRRAGRADMADAVAHEMRERRAQPEAPRSWVEVGFHDVSAEPEPEPEAPGVAAPADPYGFSAIRTVPDGGLRVSAAPAPAPRRAPRARARIARPRTGLVLGAAAVGAVAGAGGAREVPPHDSQAGR